MIQAIETEYNGYRFRSRLEARWAVFFDALGVRYEYEPEGFRLPGGDWYLPDFRVKCWGMRGDISVFNRHNLCANCKYGCGSYAYAYQCGCRYMDDRGTVETDTESNNTCCHCDGFEPKYPFDLYIEVKGHMTSKDARRIRGFAGRFNERTWMYENPILVVGDIPPVNCSYDGNVLGADEGMDYTSICPFNYMLIDCDCFGAYPAAHNGKFYLWGADSNYVNDDDVPLVEEAYTKARSARFEHGERP